MKSKIIALIKKYRAESKRDWGSNTGDNYVRTYSVAYARGYSVAYGHCADDLEELLKEEKS